MVEAAALGLKPFETWDLTLRELVLFAKGYRKSQLEEYNKLLWTVWHGAAFERSKRLPDLDRLLKKTSMKYESPKTLNVNINQLFFAMGGKKIPKKVKNG